MLLMLRLALYFSSLAIAHGRCEDWCFDACTELNGNVQRECNSCSGEKGYQCFRGADGWDNWEERAAARRRVTVDANGQAVETGQTDSLVVERTSKSLVYAKVYYEIASEKRSEDGKVVGPSAEVDEFEDGPLPVPQESPRHCYVHACVLVEGDDACADARADCEKPRGHLRPIGEQFEEMRPAVLHDMRASSLDASSFWAKSLSKSRPILLRGGTAAWTALESWSDESLKARCQLEGGYPWEVLVEKFNRIVQNDRHPLIGRWDFCQFLDEYRKPEYKNMLYLISSITEPGCGERGGARMLKTCGARLECWHFVRVAVSVLHVSRGCGMRLVPCPTLCELLHAHRPSFLLLSTLSAHPSRLPRP